MGQALSIREKQGNLVAYFEERRPDFASMIDGGEAGVEKFMRVMKNALIRDPQIAEASTQSVFLECQKCAQDGLVLDGREATLTRFKTNKRIKNGNKWEDNWQTEVVYIPMIKGLQKLVSQSPQIADWHTGLVYEKEYEQGRFKYYAGVTPTLDHEPIIVGDRGPVVAAYSIVRLRSGIIKIEVMTRAQLDGIKQRTKSRKQDGSITGPWSTDEDEMQRKTVSRRHFKSLPLTDKLSAAFERTDILYERGEAGEDIDDAPPMERPKVVANKKTTSAKAKLAAAKPTPGPDSEGDPAGDGDKVIDHDPETGEVIEDGGDEGHFDSSQDEF